MCMCACVVCVCVCASVHVGVCECMCIPVHACVVEAEKELGVRTPRRQEHLLATKQLHPQEGKDDNEEEEEEQQTYDGLHGVEEGDNQVSERCPVPADRSQSGGRIREMQARHGALPPHPLVRAPRNLQDLLCDFENTQ